MTTRYKNSFLINALDYVETLSQDVILRADLNQLGEPRQVSRAIKALVEDGYLVKIAHGAYVKAEKSKYTDKPLMKLTLTEACIKLFKRLGIQWELGTAIQDYNAGRTQQVPTQFIVKLKKRYRGHVGYGNQSIIFEGKINAR